jgi:ubiquinone/menaquinone biosynthesis C-methylase UbiE
MAGVIVEAGAGTSETSIRIRKVNRERILVAVDFVLMVLKGASRKMDVRLCADIFRLPFQDGSVDGLWNVGTMEHFSHEQIDRIMGEFRRVLKPGAPILLLWPGVHSIPQKILRGIEQLINLRPHAQKFRFHPDEISRLRSPKEGKEVLTRNGFRSVYVDQGFRTLRTFITLVGVKT